ncbi:hypothetical protein LVD15_26160 [Fulvivirga maritima]|uniref:hypothetical protein n=1 Tax=Fulvivirga maritima TaxID=2904247 RepID=UPI001F3A4D07|nr:hypothetical protein [Fulvivirga maritima]UII26738.1 hypothetical protein LVD15_26160 [Fulvivirga maritima]
MNKDELYALNFLSTLGLKELEREPLGDSSFPDFSAKDNIAIEVRRLNKQKVIDGDRVQLPECDKSIITKIVRDELERYEFLIPNSISVTLRYKRLFKLDKKAKKHFKKELKRQIIKTTLSRNFQNSVQIVPGVSVVLFEGKDTTDYAYELNIIHDYDLGGEVTKSRYEAMLVVINEKNQKISSLKDRFSEFWLILIDYISTRVDKYTIMDLHRYTAIKFNFNRIIILSRINKNQWLDLLQC